MDKTLNVFILAAGLGERLRPITDHIPKPLLPVLGRPVLQSVLEKVSTLPLNKIGINLHYKKEAIKDWINRSLFNKKVKLFPEEPALGTGGALKNAEQFLSSSTFLVHNSDILSDIDLERLIEYHHLSGNLVTLAVHDCPEFNNLGIDENGLLRGIGKAHAFKQAAFTGIAVYSPEFLKFLPSGVSGVVDTWLNALSAGFMIGTMDVSGCRWHDLGTPSAYSSAVFDALRGDGEMMYIHPSIEGCRDGNFDGYVVIEKTSKLDGSISLRNCILLPESKTENNSDHENCILGPGFKICLSHPEILGLSEENIGTGGSERKYYRMKRDGKTTVLMQCADGDPEFQRQIEYTLFFHKHSIPVPELIDVEADNMRAVFEDIGDISLYNWLKCPREKEEIENMYRQVIDIVIMIHTIATDYVSECPLLKDRLFDYDHFRWETNYFIERFVKGVKNISIKSPSALNSELHGLALKGVSFPKTVIHRDFQSQNIMITKGGTPRLIDYQGARIGPPAYDLVSILWDPYYCLGSNMQDRLVNYYINRMRDKVGDKFSEKDFSETILPCRLQRHMQALGAYGFLSVSKGKKYFLKYVPEGLRLLKEDVKLSKRVYPELYELVMGL